MTDAAGPSAQPRGSRRWRAAALAVLLIALVPRLLALRGDFWLDEVWSLDLARRAATPLEVFTKPELQQDNNHHLNTLWLRAVDGHGGVALYRLLSLLAGLGAVAAALALGRRHGKAAGLATGLLFALSYLMIANSSEARGYATGILAALGALALFERDGERDHARDGGRGTGRLVAFWLCAVAGFLSHLSFAHFYLGLLVWSGARVARARDRRGPALRRALALHAPPLAYCAWVWFVFVRHLQIGGGPEWELGPMLGQTLAWTLGGPERAAWCALLGLGVAALLAADARLARAGPEAAGRAAFDLAVIVVAPALTLSLATPPLLFPRYFSFCITALLLVLGRVAGKLWERGGAARAAGALAVALVCAGNVARDVPFLRFGRGTYSEALAYMAAHTSGPRIVLSSNHDFRALAEVDFYRATVAPQELVYLRRADFPGGGTAWFVLQSKEADGARAIEVDGVGYELAGVFPYYGPGGWTWSVYRRRG